MYTAPGTPFFQAAIFNIDDYSSNSDGTSNLSEQIVLKNTDTNSMNVDLKVYIPSGVAENAQWPAVRYANSKATTPTGSGSTDAITQTYLSKSGQPWTDSSSQDDWANTGEVDLKGSLRPNHEYVLNLPLKIINISNMNVYNMGLYMQTTATDQYGKNTGLYGVWAKPVESMADFVGVGKPVGIVLKEDTGKKASDNQPIYKYPLADDVETNAPTVSLNRDYYDINNSFWNDQMDYMYTTTSIGINASKLPTKDGKESLVSYLNQNGYSLPWPDPWNPTVRLHEVFPHGLSASNNIHVEPTPNSGTGISIQVIKVIDANNVSVPLGGKWDPYANVKIWNPKSDYQSTTLSSSDVKNNVTVTGNVDTSKAGYYSVTYHYTAHYPSLPDVQLSKTITVTVGNPNPVNPVNPTPNPSPTPAPTNPNWNPSTPNTPNGTGLPNYAAVKGDAIYATKRIYMYKNPTFKKSQRIATYPKAKRVNRPMFVVIGYDRSNGGALRYKVRDVNHGKKSAGKIGYITANRKYVVNVYYQSTKFNQTITIISKNGVHAYKNENLTGKTKTYKLGTHLKVKKIIRHNLTTRYQLKNGYYVTTNKKLVIQGKY